jgi:hypothetical protein
MTGVSQKEPKNLHNKFGRIHVWRFTAADRNNEKERFFNLAE